MGLKIIVKCSNLKLKVKNIQQIPNIRHFE